MEGEDAPSSAAGTCPGCRESAWPHRAKAESSAAKGSGDHTEQKAEPSAARGRDREHSSHDWLLRSPIASPDLGLLAALGLLKPLPDTFARDLLRFALPLAAAVSSRLSTATGGGGCSPLAADCRLPRLWLPPRPEGAHGKGARLQSRQRRWEHRAKGAGLTRKRRWEHTAKAPFVFLYRASVRRTAARPRPDDRRPRMIGANYR